MKQQCLVLVAWLGLLAAAGGGELTVLTDDLAGGPPREMLSRLLRRQAVAAVDRRLEAFEKLQSTEDIQQYKQRVRDFFWQQLGDLPPKTPLHARIVGTLGGDGYRVEKILFESQPRHYVSALLFLPESKPPFPAVLMPVGHSADGKLSNQVPAIFLARNGFAALCYDPIGQGERYQFLDAQGKRRFGPVNEHTLTGAGCIPLGRNTATLRIWDGIRALDYLESRDDIDARRIGVTGCSGGGTLSSYLMALDDRITAAAPSCYLTSFRRLLETIGPQDAEQNIFAQLAFGMDHADYLIVRAPKPTLILASTYDFFDIEGTWDTFRQAKRVYTRLGLPERVAIVETPNKHGYPQAQREAMVRWMLRWLQGVDEPVAEGEIVPHDQSQLLVTPRGQTLLLEGARSVAELNDELNRQYAAQRRTLWESAQPETLRDSIRKIAGIRPLADLPPARVQPVGTVQGDAWRAKKLILESEPGVKLPALLLTPNKAGPRRCLYVDGGGMHAALADDGPIAQLLNDGVMVLALDVRGTGELGPSGDNLWGGNWDEFFLSYLLGRSLLGQRAEDILSAARFLSQSEPANASPRVELVAVGVVGPAGLHAAALEPELFGPVRISRALSSWSDLVRHPAAAGHLVNSVHGALRVYDLPDLPRLAGRDQVKIDSPVDPARP